MQPIVSQYKTFRFVSYDFDRATGEAQFVYAIDEAFTFTERVNFSLPETASHAVSTETIDRALFALHLMAGVSYYKAYCPPQIVIESGALTVDEAAFWEKMYTLGLGEFFYRNELNFQNHIHFPVGATGVHETFQRQETSQRGVPTLLRGALLPLGGGKDSLVAVEMLRTAGVSFDLLALRGHDRIKMVAGAIGQPLAVIDRTLDPLLLELNKKDAWNGHVPITAYVIFASVVYALLHGKRDIILANEKSANSGNVTVDGVSINHQYSKSLEAERDIQNYIAASVTPDIRYFSLLRPLSELAITKKFVENGKYFNVFSSCNKNYRLVGAQQGWCGTCPKCAFVFSMLAAWMQKDELVQIFGKNLYEDAALLPMYKELLALEGIKPFECVGEPDEVFAAFALAQRLGDFVGSPIMDWFAAEILPTNTNVDAVITSALAKSAEHAMPEEYSALLYED